MENNMVNNPSTEGKAPVSTTTSGTTATSTTSTAATEANKATATAQITSGKAPAMDATATPPASTTQTATRASAETAAAASLPENYCAGGSLTDAEGIIRPEYIGTSAEALAKALRPLTATAFNAAFLKNGKDLRKKKTAYAAQKNYVLSLSTQAKKLVYRKRDPAPTMLVEMIEAASATVKDPATFEALYMHLDAIYGYLLMN